MAKPYHRTHFLVDKNVQMPYVWRLIFYVLFITAILAFALWFLNREYLSVFYRIVGENSLSKTYVRSIENQFLIELALAMIAISLFLYGVGIYTTNRFAGPLYRLTKYLKIMGRDMPAESVRIRKHDQLQELAKAFNTMIDNLEVKLNNDLELINSLKKNLSEITNAIQRGNVNPDDLIEKIKEIDALTTKLSHNTKNR